MRKYLAKQGRHNIKPAGAIIELPRLRRNVRLIEFDFYFDENANYHIDGVDQLDWNKGFGLSFNLFTNHQDSFMWAFRYNELMQQMDLISYCHVDGVVIKGVIDPMHPNGKDEPMLSIGLGQAHRTTFRAYIMRDQKVYDMQFICSSGSVSEWARVPFSHDHRISKDICAWFGGNQHSPKDFSLYSKTVRMR